MNFRIQNQAVVNRLTATSSKITKISWWEMLVNYQWIWCPLSWQIPHLTFTCKHVQFEWLRFCNPQMKQEFQASFHQLTEFPTNIFSLGKHNSMGHLLPCAIDFKTNHPPIYLQWIGILSMSTEPRHVISMGPRQPEVPSEAIVCSAS